MQWRCVDMNYTKLKNGCFLHTRARRYARNKEIYTKTNVFIINYYQSLTLS